MSDLNSLFRRQLEPPPDDFDGDWFRTEAAFYVEVPDSLQQIDREPLYRWQGPKSDRKILERGGLLVRVSVTEGEPVVPDQDPNHPNYMGEPTAEATPDEVQIVKEAIARRDALGSTNVSDRLLDGWVAITDKEGDTVHIAPGVTYHPNSDTPYQGGKQGAIIAVIQVEKKHKVPADG